MSLLEAVRTNGSDDDATWAADVSREAGRLFERSTEMGVCITRHTSDCISARSIVAGLDEQLGSVLALNDEALRAVEIPGFRRYFYPSRHAVTHLEIERDLTPEVAGPVAEMRRMLGVADALTIVAHPLPGTVVVLCTFAGAPVRLSPAERLLLTRIALHIETSFRLRHRPELVLAELDERGRVLHREERAPPDAVLASHAARIARAKSRHATSEERLALWPALAAGRFTLVERGRGKGRRYLVVENAPAAQPLKALDAGELEVVAQASRGVPAKLISYALGVSHSTVSNRLTSAAMKVGVATRLELVRLAATLTRDPRGGFETMVLTDAERDVLDLLQLGLSNEEIARMRSRSVRTIANQVASLLRKTGSSSRRALFAKQRDEAG